jgi:hypothetical protein
MDGWWAYWRSDVFAFLTTSSWWRGRSSLRLPACLERQIALKEKEKDVYRWRGVSSLPCTVNSQCQPSKKKDARTANWTPVPWATVRHTSTVLYEQFCCFVAAADRFERSSLGCPMLCQTELSDTSHAPPDEIWTHDINWLLSFADQCSLPHWATGGDDDESDK